MSTSIETEHPPADPPRARRGRSRWVVPLAVILVGLIAFAVSGALASKLPDVQENDNAAFLPDSAESTKSLDLEPEFSGATTIPALIVWERPEGVTDADRAAVADAAERMSAIKGVAGPASAPVVSEDGKAIQVIVSVPEEDAFENTAPVDEMRTIAASVPGMESHVTGPGGLFADFSKAFEGIDGRLVLTTVGVVLIILLIIYRSPVFVPVLITAGLALFLAEGIVYLLAKADILTVNGQSASILPVLVLGAGTDYALLLISRYKEELHRQDSAFVAMRHAMHGAVPPILASGATVMVGLLCLLLSDLNSNKSLGPVAAIGILCSIVAMLTFLPAVLVAVGRYWFWPFIPRHDEVATAGKGLWGRVAELVGRRTRVVWVVTFVLLIAAASLVVRLDVGGISTADSFTNTP